MSDSHPGAQARAARLLHLVLTIGAAVFSATFVLLVTFRGPLLLPDASTRVIAFAFAGLGLTAVAFAGFLLRPRVPARTREQSVEEFWTPPVRSRAMLLWIVCENGAIMAGLGYVLTGSLVPLAVIAFAMVALVWYSPARLAGEP